jgi:uncharacterized protein (TIGR00730 family)
MPRDKERQFIKADKDTSHGAIHPVDPKEAKFDSKYIQTPVESMHERKKLMADISRAFLALPGGYGTLEELAEMTTWTQLGIRESQLLSVLHRLPES